MEKEKAEDNCKEFVVVGIMIEKDRVPYSDIEESIMILGGINAPLNFVKIFQEALSNKGVEFNDSDIKEK